jgi:hypothetical protein
MASGTGKLRDGDVWVDCAAAEAAYERAKADQERFSKFKEKGWTGQLSRIRGRRRGGVTQPFVRVYRSNLKAFAEICGVEINQLLAGGDGSEAPSTLEAGPTLSFLPISGVNFVRLGSENYTQGAEFTFSLKMNLMSLGYPFVLLGFCALYYAPDGCICKNGEQDIRVNENKSPTAGNDLDFQAAVPITNGIGQVTCGRRVRPPLMIQEPADCDYGDVCVRAHVLWNNAPKLIERFFRFELGGNLTPIDRQRDVPVLSDRVLDELRAKGLLTAAEFERATKIDAVDRYHVVRFPNYCTQVYPRAGGFWDVTPEYRGFLAELHERAIANR